MIVTRAEPGASETAARLDAAGYTPILSPALELAEVGPRSPLDLEGVAGLLFTSANGVRFFCQREPRRDFKAWCVGPATATAAEAAGFVDIVNARGGSDELAAEVTASADPAAGELVHVANTAAAGDLAGRLKAAGFRVRYVGLYEARRARALDPDAVEALSSEAAAAVLIHSAKGAKAFLELAAGLDLEPARFVAISAAVAAPLAAISARTVVAEHPDEDALLTALKRVAPSL